MLIKFLRTTLVTLLTATLFLQLRDCWEAGRPAESEALVPMNFSEELEDYTPAPAEPLKILTLGGAITAEGLGLPADDRTATLNQLIAASRSSELRTVRIALLGIRRMHDPAALPRLYEMLKVSLAGNTLDPVKKQLVWTVGVLALPGDYAQWKPQLTTLLSDKDPAVRDYSAFALTRLRTPEAALLTLAAMLDPNRKPITRGRAALALADGGFSHYITQMRKAIVLGEPCDFTTRVERALWLLGEPRR